MLKNIQNNLIAKTLKNKNIQKIQNIQNKINLINFPLKKFSSSSYTNTNYSINKFTQNQNQNQISNSNLFKTKEQFFSSLPEEIYSTPIFDKENKKFSEAYLNFLFNKQNLIFTNKNILKEKEIICTDIVTLLDYFSEIPKSKKYFFEKKLNYIMDYLYKNMHHFSCFQLIKIFKKITKNKLQEINLLAKLNFYIASKLNIEKKIAFEDKEKFENFLNKFFVHFENSVENGVLNKRLLNDFIGILSRENLKKFLANEGNLINVLTLISEGIATINELEENHFNNGIEKIYLECEKNVLNKNTFLSLLKLFENLENFLSIESVDNITNSSNSRNKLYKSLIFLKSEGITFGNFSKIQEFLTNYNYPLDEICTDNDFAIEKYKKIVEKFLDDNRVLYEKDKDFKICKGNYIINPGFIINIYMKDEYSSGDLLKGKFYLNNRYLKMLNYDVINLSSELFEESDRKTLYDILLQKINEIKEFNEIYQHDKFL